jgi:hypothetical protein
VNESDLWRPFHSFPVRSITTELAENHSPLPFASKSHSRNDRVKPIQYVRSFRAVRHLASVQVRQAAEILSPARLDQNGKVAIAFRKVDSRRRSQVAKAADCKSAIVGSTPTGASFLFPALFLAPNASPYRREANRQTLVKFFGPQAAVTGHPEAARRL